MEATALAQQSTAMDCHTLSPKMATAGNSPSSVSRAREILDAMREKREAMSKKLSDTRCPDTSCYPVKPPTRQNSRRESEDSSKPRDARLIIHSLRERREHLEKRARQIPLVTDSCYSRSRSNRTKSTVLTCDDEQDRLDTSLNQSLVSMTPSVAMTEASSYICQNDDSIHKGESLLGSRDAQAKLSASRSKLSSQPILTLSDIELPRELNSRMRGKGEELSSSPFWNSITSNIHDDENSTTDELFVSCSSKVKLHDSSSRLSSWKEESAFHSILGSSVSRNSSDDIPKVSNSTMDFLEDHKQRQKQLATMIERVQKMKSESIPSLQLGQQSGVPINPMMMMMDEEDDLLDVTSNSDTSGWFTSSGEESDLVYSQTEDDQENGENEGNEGDYQVDDDMSELTFQWEYEPLEQDQARVVGTDNKAPEPPSSSPPPIIVTGRSQSEDSDETNEVKDIQAPTSNQRTQRLQPNQRDKVTGGLYYIADLTGMVKNVRIDAPLPLVHLPVRRDVFVSESVADARCGAKGHVFMALQSPPDSDPDLVANTDPVEGEDEGNGGDAINQQNGDSNEVQLIDLVKQSMIANKIGSTEILHESDQNVGGFTQSAYQGSVPCQFVSFREALESCGKSQSSLSTISASVVSRDHSSVPGHQLSGSTPSSKATNPSAIPQESARETNETTNVGFPILNSLWKAAKALRSGAGSHAYIAQKTNVSPHQLEKTTQAFQTSPGRKKNADNIIPLRVSDARCQASGGHSYLVSRSNIPLRYEV